MSIYQLVLFGHSYVRWLVLLLAVLVLIRAFAGWMSARPWNPVDERLHASLTGVVDLQFLLGLLLYLWLSPLTWAFYSGLSASMKEPILRFYGLEHAIAMLIAMAVLHIGRKRSQRAGNGALRHRRVWVSVLIALLLMGASIPWPNFDYGRPLFRGLGLASFVP